MGRGYRATGSQPRRWRTDWRYSHSMASLSRWARRPPLVMPAMSATPRRVPTETTNPLSWKVNASSDDRAGRARPHGSRSAPRTASGRPMRPSCPRELMPSSEKHLAQVVLRGPRPDEQPGADLRVRTASAASGRPAPPARLGRRACPWCACAPSRLSPGAPGGPVRRTPRPRTGRICRGRHARRAPSEHPDCQGLPPIWLISSSWERPCLMPHAWAD